MISNIKTLFLMRVIVVMILSALLLLGFFLGFIQLNLFPIILVQVFPLIFIFITYKAQSKQSIEHHPFLIFLYLVTDVIYLSCFFSLFGGAGNPLTGFYMIPILLAGLLLPVSLAIVIYVATLLAYSLNTVVYFPLNSIGDFKMTFHQLHQWGMMITFLITAALSLGVIFFLVKNIRKKEQDLVEIKSARQLDTQITKMGLVAVNSVHEMATPLSSLEMLFDIFETECTIDSDTIKLGKKQLEHCKKTLARILKTFGQSNGEKTKVLSIKKIIELVIVDLKCTYPESDIESTIAECADIKIDGLFQDVVFNLLMNSAAVSQKIKCDFFKERDGLVLEIIDNGGGLNQMQTLHMAQSLTDQMQAYLYDKASTHGIGLILVQYMLKRLNGRIYFPNPGTCRVEIPLKAFKNED